MVYTCMYYATECKMLNHAEEDGICAISRKLRAGHSEFLRCTAFPSFMQHGTMPPKNHMGAGNSVLVVAGKYRLDHPEIMFLYN